MHRNERAAMRVLTLLVMAISASSCTSWRPPSGPLPEATASKPNPVVRLHLRTGNAILMYHPQLKGDSIVGYDRPSTPQADHRIAFLKSDVLELKVKKTNLLLTIVVVVFASWPLLLVIGGLTSEHHGL